MKSERRLSQTFLGSALTVLGCLGFAVVSAAGCSGSEDGDGDGSADGMATGGTTSGSGGNGSGGLSLDAGTGSTTGTGGAGGDGTGGTGECGGTAVNAEPVQVNLLLVIDKSDSMDQEPEGFGGTKWAAMVSSLKTALDGVAADMSVGLQFFPDEEAESGTVGVSGCELPDTSGGIEISVPIGAGTETVPEIKTTLDDSTPSGNTPTAGALQIAFDYFDSGPGKDLEGENYVLLALDGGPNCNADLTCEENRCTTNIEGQCPAAAGNCCESVPESCLDDAQVEAKIEQLANAGITTFVVGIPGSDLGIYPSVLDSLAVAGGSPASDTSPRYYKVEDPEALTETLTSLTTQLVTSCELQLEMNPPDMNKVNVFIDDVVVPQEGDDGWEYDQTTDPFTIRIKGATCAALESTGAQSVRVEFGCPTIKIK